MEADLERICQDCHRHIITELTRSAMFADTKKQFISPNIAGQLYQDFQTKLGASCCQEAWLS